MPDQDLVHSLGDGRSPVLPETRRVEHPIAQGLLVLAL